MARAAAYAPQGLGLKEPGANKASNPKPGSKNAATINPNKSTGQLDAALGKGADASYQAFVKSQQQQKQQPNNSQPLKVPKAPAPANAAPKGLLGKLSTYAKAAVTSPVATVKDIVTKQPIKAVDNGAIIVDRMPEAASQAQKQADGKTGPGFKLDHTQSLEIGGDNNPKNLKDVPTKQWASYTPVEDYLGAQVKANKINAQQAKQLMNNFKTGKVSAQDTINAAQKQQKGTSLVSKVVKSAKGVASSAVSSERAVAQPVARLLPGGQNDLKAENAAIDTNNQDRQTAMKMINSGKPGQVAVGKKLLAQNQKDTATTSKQVGQTAKAIKTETSAAHIASGVAGTAADVLTAGTLPELKGASLLAKTGRTAIKGAAYGTAGALNSASSGGNKKQIAENFAAGAALPGILHVAGKAPGAVVDKVTGGQATKDLVANAKTQSLLSKSQPSAPLSAETAKSLDSIMSKVHTPGKVIANQKAQAEAVQAADKNAADTAKVVQDNQVKADKIDQQVELINAKKADGKFTNVDKVKVQQLKDQKAQLVPPTVEPAATGSVPTEGSMPKTGSAAPTAEAGAGETVTPAALNPDTIKAQIKSIRNEDKNYDDHGNITPEAGKQLNALHKQLNAVGERIPKSEKPVTVTPIDSEPRIETPDIRTAKLAQGVEQNAIKKGLTQGFEGKAEYAGMKVDQQAKHAAELLKTDPVRAVSIAMGHEKPPGDLLPESVFIAVEHQATKAGDHQLLNRLATESHLTSEASGMGQRIRMLGERENNSPVTAIKQVADARKAVVEKRLGKPVAKAVNDEVRQIRAAKPKITEETWSSFLDTLKC